MTGDRWKRARPRQTSVIAGALTALALALSSPPFPDLAASTAQAQASCAEPTGGCAEALPARCLQTLGAGSVATADADCAERLSAYRACLTQAAAACADVAPSPGGGAELLAPATRGFLAALRTELAGNLDKMRALRDEMDLTGATAIYENEWPELSRRVIGATSNPAYFTAPVEWMAGAERLYEETERLITDSETRYAYRRQVTSVLYQRRLIRERLEALIAEGETELMPAIDAQLSP